MKAEVKNLGKLYFLPSIGLKMYLIVIHKRDINLLLTNTDWSQTHINQQYKQNAIMLACCTCACLTISLSLVSAQTPALSSTLSPEVLSLCQSWTTLIITGSETSLTAALMCVPSLCECEPVLTFAVGMRSEETLQWAMSRETGLSLFTCMCGSVYISSKTPLNCESINMS